jgi:hypothetical protein
VADKDEDDLDRELIGMTSAIFLVTGIVFHWTVTLLVTAAIAAAFAWFWYALPLRRRVQSG